MPAATAEKDVLAKNRLPAAAGFWQRGGNKYTISLLEQYLPKSIDISGYSQHQLNAIARQLNKGPRKTLGFQTPAEMFSESVASTR